MDNETRHLLKSILLLLGGAVLSVVGSALVIQITCGPALLVMLTLIAVFFILLGSGTLGSITSAFRRFCRSKQIRRPLVGILNGLSSSDKIKIPGVWTDIPPSEWAEELRKVSIARKSPIRIRLIPANRIHDGYAAIINPFGGTYPESSFDGFPIYKTLLGFIRRGGMFVNVADLPTYFAFNPLLSRSIDRTPVVYTSRGQSKRFFTRIPLLEELAMQTWNCESLGQVQFQLSSDFASCGPPQVSLTVTRLASIGDGDNLRAILEVVMNGRRVTPLWLSRYGNGQVLASISFLDAPYTSNRVLVSLLANIIVQQVTKKE